ncbi:uncharacterized protein G2W53_015761 [Senna tora]|uniref:Uncharacterized protein n=1 Tax=Senna tora TaxID=362788 RepID=A0A834WWY0_9FABA|nr:uncharacterized protein G2W53_015761 [Senna tora]
MGMVDVYIYNSGGRSILIAPASCTPPLHDLRLKGHAGKQVTSNEIKFQIKPQLAISNGELGEVKIPTQFAVANDELGRVA